MTILTVNVEDALMERILDIATKRGADTTQVVVEALEQVFKPETANTTKSIGQEILDLLAPSWAEQQAHPERFQPMPENAGDQVEEYLTRPWADDLRKESTRGE